jgi:hypothetical protein
LSCLAFGDTSLTDPRPSFPRPTRSGSLITPNASLPAPPSHITPQSTDPLLNTTAAVEAGASSRTTAPHTAAAECELQHPR